jgi:Secretion system C-terminal sorting domain
MKKLVLILLLSSGFGFISQAQTIYYRYDPAGNRDYRGIVPRLDESSSLQTVQEYGVSVYPNPSSDNLNVAIANLQVTDKAIVYLFDNAGKKLYEKNQNASLCTLDMKGLPAGMYYLRIKINADEMVYKIMKQE